MARARAAPCGRRVEQSRGRRTATSSRGRKLPPKAQKEQPTSRYPYCEALIAASDELSPPVLHHQHRHSHTSCPLGYNYIHTYIFLSLDLGPTRCRQPTISLSISTFTPSDLPSLQSLESRDSHIHPEYNLTSPVHQNLSLSLSFSHISIRTKLSAETVPLIVFHHRKG